MHVDVDVLFLQSGKLERRGHEVLLRVLMQVDAAQRHQHAILEHLREHGRALTPDGEDAVPRSDERLGSRFQCQYDVRMPRRRDGQTQRRRGRC